MIAEIGLMIGAYIVARCLDMIVQQINHFPTTSGWRAVLSVVVIVASGAALVAATLLSAALIFDAASFSSKLPVLPQ